MSAAAARATRPASRPAARPSGSPAARSVGYLRLVATRRSHAARAPFVAVVVGILAAGLLGLLLLNTVLAQDAFRLHALQLQSHALADQEQQLQRDVEHLQSPQTLASRATALGMVPGGPPAFLRLPDGKVLGDAVPAPAAPPPAAPVAPKTATTTSTSTPPAAAPKEAAPAAGTWVTVSPTGAHTTKASHKASQATTSHTTAGGHR
jgi:type II secretory pathway pseudopilin PulG